MNDLFTLVKPWPNYETLDLPSNVRKASFDQGDETLSSING